MSKLPAYTAKLAAIRRDMLVMHDRAGRLKVGTMFLRVGTHTYVCGFYKGGWGW